MSVVIASGRPISLMSATVNDWDWDLKGDRKCECEDDSKYECEYECEYEAHIA